MPRQLGPNGRSDLRTSVLHRKHDTTVAMPVMSSVEVRSNLSINQNYNNPWSFKELARACSSPKIQGEFFTP
jgi:hypothetical protein